MRSLLADGSPSAKECLLANLGRVVGRNGCRGPWSESLNIQWRPPMPKRWDGRVTPTVYIQNVLAGVDQALHGTSDLRGWGSQPTPDPVLLVPRGFDPSAKSFRYDVNPRFADTRAGRNTALRTLLEFGLDRYRRVAVVDASRVYGEVDTSYDQPSLELVAERTLVRTVREGTPLLERTVQPTRVALPVRAGQRLGRVEVWEGDRRVASSNLIAAESVSEPSTLGKAWWFVGTTTANAWEIVT